VKLRTEYGISSRSTVVSEIIEKYGALHEVRKLDPCVFRKAKRAVAWVHDTYLIATSQKLNAGFCLIVEIDLRWWMSLRKANHPSLSGAHRLLFNNLQSGVNLVSIA
jgi:hypothetical protein